MPGIVKRPQPDQERRGASRAGIVRPAAPPQRVMPSVPAPARKPVPQPGPSGAGMARLHGSLAPAAPVRPAAAPVAKGQPRTVAPAAPTAPAAAALAFTAVPHQEIASDLSTLTSTLTDLQSRATFNQVAQELNSLDNSLADLVQLLESARAEGYQYGGSLDGKVYQTQGQWEGIRAGLFDELQRHAATAQSRLPALNPLVARLNASLSNPAMARPLLQSTQSQANSLLQSIDQLETSLENRYTPIRTALNDLRTRLTRIHWAMDQLAGARFQLSAGEALVMAVAACWDKEDKDDPEGLLYLTDRRLVFERKEKVAKKKVLFITTASELVQEVLVDQPLSTIRSASGESKGFLGHQDFLRVEFSNAPVDCIDFHITGQDSKEWAVLINTARSGGLQNDRYQPGAVSVTDLTRPLTAADIVAAQNEVSQLQDEVMLTSARQELLDLENRVASLGRGLAEVRSRGYALEKDLEADVLVLSSQWDRIKASADGLIDFHAKVLSEHMTSMLGLASQVVGYSGNLAQAKPLYMQLKSAIASTTAQAEAAHQTVTGTYQSYAAEVDGFAAHLDWLNWMLDALASAGFRLLATECGIAATEAQWTMPGLEPENGILFLTDQRLLWEDRVGTFELKVEVPLAQIMDCCQETTPEGKESLRFTFGAGAPFSGTAFTLALPVAAEWVKMFGRARSGEYSLGRAVEVSPEELERIRNAPRQCEKCGGAITAPILRGQTEVTCEYCGLAMPI